MLVCCGDVDFVAYLAAQFVVVVLFVGQIIVAPCFQFRHVACELVVVMFAFLFVVLYVDTLSSSRRSSQSAFSKY